MKSAHTPTPWKHSYNGSYWEIRPVNQDLETLRIGDVCASDPQYPDSGIQEANAALIVKAVNAHEDLVKALEAVYSDWKAIADAEQYRDKNIDALVLAALKTAKGE